MNLMIRSSTVIRCLGFVNIAYLGISLSGLVIKLSR